MFDKRKKTLLLGVILSSILIGLFVYFGIFYQPYHLNEVNILVKSSFNKPNDFHTGSMIFDANFGNIYNFKSNKNTFGPKISNGDEILNDTVFCVQEGGKINIVFLFPARTVYSLKEKGYSLKTLVRKDIWNHLPNCEIHTELYITGVRGISGLFVIILKNKTTNFEKKVRISIDFEPNYQKLTINYLQEFNKSSKDKEFIENFLFGGFPYHKTKNISNLVINFPSSWFL